ncbi:MAG: serine protein kinase, partial [Proteobacteria bacterium]|nr:serine protein kinase [Pseudomonadota bacterium]
MSEINVISLIGELQDVQGFREQYWEGSFAEYLDIVKDDPKVARSAYQRLYDMILSYGTEEYTRHRETIVHY